MVEETELMMKASPDLSKAIKFSRYISSKPEHAAEIETMYQEAKEFLEFYDWCTVIKDSFIGMIYPGVVAVFLFEIESSRPDVDDWIWVVVGDLPPAYLTTEECPNPASALDGYIGAMQEWVKAAREGAPIIGLIPVNVPATKANAMSLKIRLDFLDERILSKYKDDLKPA